MNQNKNNQWKKRNLPRDHMWIMTRKQKMINENFPRFIVLETISNRALTEISPFKIQKAISNIIIPKNVKKLPNGTLLVEVDKKDICGHINKTKKTTRNRNKVLPTPNPKFLKGCSKKQGALPVHSRGDKNKTPNSRCYKCQKNL